MRILAYKPTIFYTLTVLISSVCAQAQDTNVKVKQDVKIEQLLTEKRKLNTAVQTSDNYKVQIFSGDSESAKKMLKSFKQEFPDTDVTMVFNTPNYKVWAGNFESRIEAEHDLLAIRKRFSNALLIKPSK